MSNVLPFHAPSGDDGAPLYTTPQGRDLFCFDQGYGVGYDQGQADAAAVFADECLEIADRTRLWVTWAMVLAFLAGGVFGVAVCAYVWPLVDAGVLP